MSELKLCRVCLDSNVRMHEISGTEVQEVFEMLSDEKLSPRAQKDESQYFACYLCYGNLRNCSQLLKKLRKSEELLKVKSPTSNELNLESTAADSLPNGQQNSLTVSKIETFETPQYNVRVKTENQDENDTEDLILKCEPDDETRCLPYGLV